MDPQNEENKALFSKVFLNQLILVNIFCNMSLSELLPFRLVCKSWASIINLRVSEDGVVRFQDFGFLLDTSSISPIHKFHMLRTLKLRTVSFRMHWNRFMALKKNNYGTETWEICKEIAESGGQVKALQLVEGGGLYLRSNQDAERFKKILTTFPNLISLRVVMGICVPLFVEEFQDFVFPTLQVLNLNRSGLIGYENKAAEEFVKHIFKIFPNLKTNMNNDCLDCALICLVKEGKIDGTNLRKFLNTSFADKQSEYPKFLKEVPVRVYPIAHFEISSISTVDPVDLTEILKNFATTLETVILRANKDTMTRPKLPSEICVPPLPKLRKMVLELPSFYPENQYTYWNLGKWLAKDFPLLEYLLFKPHKESHVIDDDYEYYHYDEDFVFDEPCRRMWESFVSLSADDGDVDLSPLKFLKFVDLSIPKNWIGPEECRDWGHQFLGVYLKVYGCGGKGTIQNMIDWLR